MIALHADLRLRVLAGTMLGAVIGYERRIHRRPAGLRTHLLVALAASVFKEDNMVTRRVSLTLGDDAPPWPALMAALRARHVAITPGQYERRIDEGSGEVTFQARGAGDA